MNESISIIIISYKREKLLKKCLDQIFLTFNFKYEVIIVFNEGFRNNSLCSEFPKIITLITNNLTPANARNLAIQKAQNDYILFLDDDVLPPPNYSNTLTKILRENRGLDIIGGPDTLYPDASYLEVAISNSLKSPLISSVTSDRHSSGKKSVNNSSEKSLTLCNLLIKKECFNKTGIIFNNKFKRNEENILLHELSLKGYKLSYFPDLYIYHKRRSNIIKLSKVTFQSGYYRAKGNYLYPHMNDFRFYIPALFIIYLLLISAIGLIPLYTYLILISLQSLIQSFNMGLHFFPSLLLLHPVMNISYGLGTICGITSETRFKK